MSNVVKFTRVSIFPIFTMIDEKQLMDLFANFDVNNSCLNDRVDKFIGLMFQDHEDKEYIKRRIVSRVT